MSAKPGITGWWLSLFVVAAIAAGCISTPEVESELRRINALDGSSWLGVKREAGREIKSVELKEGTIVLQLDGGGVMCTPKVYPVRVLYREFVIDIPLGSLAMINHSRVLVYKGEVAVRYGDENVTVGEDHYFWFWTRNVKKALVTH